MNRPQLCLTLTGSTLDEDLNILETFRNYVDMAELRVDFLNEENQMNCWQFPQKAGVPCILTIRRKIDGGKFEESEEKRCCLFEKIFSESEKKSGKQFALVDFEEDFHFAGLEAAAKKSGTRIIRSVHDFEKPVTDIIGRVKKLQEGTDEIAKIAFMPSGLKDVTNLFEQAAKLNGEHILLAMGPYGIPSRILAAKLGNYLTFTSPAAAGNAIGNLAHLDPVTMNEIYHFRELTKETSVYGITGFPLAATSSPKLHNDGYKLHKMDAVYIPVKAENVEEALDFNRTVNLTGMSVTIPHKEKVMPLLSEVSGEVKEIGACNTIVKKADGWHGYNTDAPGFSKALLEFLNLKDLKGKKAAIIGAGGAACAVIYAVKKMGAEACIFNRTVSKAKTLAEKFGFEYAGLDEESLPKLKEYSDIIIQTTSKGMGSNEPANEENDPVYFYKFDGHEQIFDIVYVPEVTPVMARAAAAGCRVCNGFNMLRYQGYEQFELFTGVKY